MTEQDERLARALQHATKGWKYDREQVLRAVRSSGARTQTRKGMSRWGTVAVGLAVGGLSVAILGYMMSLRDSVPSPTPANSSAPGAAPSGDVKYVPPRVSSAGLIPGVNIDSAIRKTSLSVAFVDGTAAILRYPSDLALEDLGVLMSGNVVFDLPDGSLLRGHDVIRFSPVNGALAPPGPLGPETEWSADTIQVRLGHWLLRITDLWRSHGGHVTPNLVEEFASSIGGRITEEGFLVLDLASPARLASPEEGTEDPTLDFGTGMVLTAECRRLQGDQVTTINGFEVHRYTDYVDVGEDFVAWCDSSESILFEFYSEALADELAPVLEVTTQA